MSISRSHPANRSIQAVLCSIPLVITLLTQGCVLVGIDYETPRANSPDAWTVSVKGDLERPANLAKWWKAYNDPTLDLLIEKTRGTNRNLKIASQNISTARAQRGVAKSFALATLNGDGSYSRNRTSEFLAISGAKPHPLNYYITGFDAGWEIDVFGGLRRNIEASEANLEASIELYRDVLVTLLSETALNYIEYRTLEERIRIAISNAAAQRSSVELTQSRLDAGLAPRIDVTQATTNFERTRALIPQLKIQLDAVRNRLASLTAESPSSMIEILHLYDGIPAPPRGYSAGMPCDLIRARPDIRAAERQLARETALIGVAEADLYPRFILFGDFSLETITANNFWNTAASSYSFGPAIRWQIFSAGRVRNNIKIEEAAAEQALQNYENTVLIAVEEVENSMSAIANGWDRFATLARADSSARETVDLIKENYQNGLVDFQRVLEAERTKFMTEDDLAIERGNISRSYVALYKALGGGSEPSLSAVP